MTTVGGPGRTFILASVGQELGAVVAKVHRHDLKAPCCPGLESNRHAIRTPIRFGPIILFVEITRDLGDPLRVGPVSVDNIHLIVAKPVGREGNSATVGAEGRASADSLSALDTLRGGARHRTVASQRDSPQSRPAIVIASRVDDAESIRRVDRRRKRGVANLALQDGRLPVTRFVAMIRELIPNVE